MRDDTMSFWTDIVWPLVVIAFESIVLLVILLVAVAFEQAGEDLSGSG